MAVDPQDCVEDRVRDTVLSSPSVFGRLVAVSGLRNEDKKYYHALSWQHGVAAVDNILRNLHCEVFKDWLALSLRQQQGDLTIFLRAIGDIRPSAHGLTALCQSLVPERHLETERVLFLNDIRGDLLGLLPNYGPCAIRRSDNQAHCHWCRGNRKAVDSTHVGTASYPYCLSNRESLQ